MKISYLLFQFLSCPIAAAENFLGPNHQHGVTELCQPCTALLFLFRLVPCFSKKFNDFLLTVDIGEIWRQPINNRGAVSSVEVLPWKKLFQNFTKNNFCFVRFCNQPFHSLSLKLWVICKFLK